MPARDPLAVLARLRRLETDQARRLLAGRMAATTAAEARIAAAATALATEGAVAGQPGDYGLWLVRGLAERDRAAFAGDQARQAEAEAMAGLASARAQERAVEELRRTRAEASRREALRREQATIDAAAARRTDRPG